MRKLPRKFEILWVIFFNCVIYADNNIAQNIANPFANKTADFSMEIAAELFPLRYASAEELAALLQDKSISIDKRSNALLIRDTPDRLIELRRLIKKLDIPAKQVSISARIVNIDTESVKELGIKFASSGKKTESSNDLNMDMPVEINRTGHLTLAIAKLSQDTLLDLELSALENEGHAKIISNPELITSNHQAAIIESGQEIPYQEKTNSGATNVTFKKAVLSLNVTPEITAKNKIILNLTVNQDRVSPLSVNGVPAINTQALQTQVQVNNGETLVLGGIHEQNDRKVIEKIPFIGSIPLLGALFTSKETSSERKELLVFVTPKIIE